MKFICKALYVSLLMLALSACVPANVKPTMTNTSPEPEIRQVTPFKVIPASVRVTSNETTFAGDISTRLNREKIFKSVSDAGDFALHVHYVAKSDLHTGEGLGNAVLSGLTFGLVGESAPDRYDYSVTLNAELKHKGKMVSKYDAVGSYYGEVPESSSLASKLDRTNQAVLKSHEHAMALLMAKLKQDRKKIISFK